MRFATGRPPGQVTNVPSPVAPPRSRASRIAVAALWGLCVALVAAAPFAGGFGNGGGQEPEAGAPFPADPWPGLVEAAGRVPRPEPTVKPSEEPVERVVQADLLEAPVPSLCGHPAGVLVDGKLPGIADGDGVVWVFTEANGRIPPGRVAYGTLGDQPGGGAAVAVYCDKGGVGWPEAVVLYGPGPEYLGHVVLSDLAPGRQVVEWIGINRGVVRVRFTDTYAADESGCCGRLDGTVALRVDDDGEVRVDDPEFVDERPTAEEALVAAAAPDSAALSGLATSDAATALLAVLQAPRDPAAGALALGECAAPAAGAPGGTRATCELVDATGVVANLHLERTGFAQWRLIGVAAPAGSGVAS